MTTRKYRKSINFRKTRSKRQRGGVINNNIQLIRKSMFGNTKAVEKLLATKGINVNAKNSDGYTALILASSNGHTEIVRMLLKHPKIEVNATDDDGDTALMKVINCDEDDERPWYQVEYDITENMEMLLAAGANVNVVNNNNKTAFAIAEETGCTKKIQSLLKRPERQMVPEITAMMRRTTGQNVDPNISRYIGEKFIGGKRKTRKNSRK